MSKNDLLTESEFQRYIPNPRAIQYIEEFRKSGGLEKSGLRILDWGCGRGRTALWLREQGYPAYGVDINAKTIENGLPLFAERGFDGGDLLRTVGTDGKTDFPAGFFDFILSEQVFEHVRDLDAIAAEMSRITRTRGQGFHSLPAHKYFIEGHLNMPLVHWLPKNNLRKMGIAACVAIGREPHWKELAGSSLGRKADYYYRYSVEKTYYRSYREIRRMFTLRGFSVSFEIINRPKIQTHPITRLLMRTGPTKSLLNYLLLTFKEQELLVEKTSTE